VKYLRVDTTRHEAGEPVMFYSELDEHRVETRKVEIFPNGNSRTTLGGDATSAHNGGSRRFDSVEISREEFELVWNRWAR
jgi:hypothetical protein